jgi:hypothetical protein
MRLPVGRPGRTEADHVERRLGIVGLLAWAGVAWAADPVAVLTEIRPAGGTVGVRIAGELEWTVPQPLSALRPGD